MSDEEDDPELTDMSRDTSGTSKEIDFKKLDGPHYALREALRKNLMPVLIRDDPLKYLEIKAKTTWLGNRFRNAELTEEIVKRVKTF